MPADRRRGRRGPRTLSLHIPFDIVFSCFVLFLVLTIAFSVVRLRRLLGSDWRDEL